jgi:hypothetical protein
VAHHQQAAHLRVPWCPARPGRPGPCPRRWGRRSASRPSASSPAGSAPPSPGWSRSPADCWGEAGAGRQQAQEHRNQQQGPSTRDGTAARPTLRRRSTMGSWIHRLTAPSAGLPSSRRRRPLAWPAPLLSGLRVGLGRAAWPLPARRDHRRPHPDQRTPNPLAHDPHPPRTEAVARDCPVLLWDPVAGRQPRWRTISVSTNHDPAWLGLPTSWASYTVALEPGTARDGWVMTPAGPGYPGPGRPGRAGAAARPPGRARSEWRRSSRALPW